jgi:hypothetical protein
MPNGFGTEIAHIPWSFYIVIGQEQPLFPMYIMGWGCFGCVDFGWRNVTVRVRLVVCAWYIHRPITVVLNISD